MKLISTPKELPYQYLAIGITIGFLAPYAWELWISQKVTAQEKVPPLAE